MQHNPRCRLLSGLISTLLLPLFAALSVGISASAQAFPTQSKGAAVSAFIGYTNSSPDYGDARNWGGTAGVDYTRYFRWRVAPSFEVRANRATGKFVTEEAALAGLRLETGFRRYHPYADALIGGTKILFVIPSSPHTSDTGRALSFGGGVDIDLVHHFQAKIDYQFQDENYGINRALQPNGDFTLSPSMLTLGVVYRIPFKPRNR